MIKAKFSFKDSKETFEVMYPDTIKDLVTRYEHKPYKCKIVGSYSPEEAMDLEKWVKQEIIPFMGQGCEVVNWAVKTYDDQAPARVDKQALEGIMRFFEYGHLPEQLQKVSAPICDMAQQLYREVPDCEEKAAGLRKLLEAKDCFVRASFDK